MIGLTLELGSGSIIELSSAGYKDAPSSDLVCFWYSGYSLGIPQYGLVNAMYYKPLLNSCTLIEFSWFYSLPLLCVGFFDHEFFLITLKSMILFLLGSSGGHAILSAAIFLGIWTTVYATYSFWWSQFTLMDQCCMKDVGHIMASHRTSLLCIVKINCTFRLLNYGLWVCKLFIGSLYLLFCTSYMENDDIGAVHWMLDGKDGERYHARDINVLNAIKLQIFWRDHGGTIDQFFQFCVYVES
uniref:Uncharacterized protein n=1 Tax=Tanacetum cinerariifolium TaxID=118510 RepID=A0A6L2NPM5_TANCI|nr:hypothetical protein [Tanacetum cinerariifolium]